MYRQKTQSSQLNVEEQSCRTDITQCQVLQSAQSISGEAEVNFKSEAFKVDANDFSNADN
jgi:hypothetical protein